MAKEKERSALSAKEEKFNVIGLRGGKVHRLWPKKRRSSLLLAKREKKFTVIDQKEKKFTVIDQKEKKFTVIGQRGGKVHRYWPKRRKSSPLLDKEED